MNRKTIAFLVTMFLAMAIFATIAFAATTPPSWVSTESQNRMGTWFLKDQREAIYSTLGDLTDAGGFWATVGNSGTTAGTHFVGTTDAKDLVFKAHNTEVFRLADGANATWTGDGGTDLFNLLVGNLKVGNGTPTVTLNGEDAYIEGTLEADGAVRFDSTLEVNNTITLQNDETISNANDGELALTTSNIWVGDDHTITTGSAASGILSGNSSELYSKYSVIAGGVDNVITATAIADDTRYSVISGGSSNEIHTTGDVATIGGGTTNVISGTSSYDTIAGGYTNQITSAGSAVISGGGSNAVSAAHGMVGGGYDNDVSGEYGMIPGGMSNVVTGTHSLAAGRRANAIHNGTFVWADSTDADYSSAAANTFNVRASGGVILDADVVTQAGFQVYPENATYTSARFDCVNTVAYTDVTSKTMCILPANVNIVDIELVVTTLFNDSGTDTLNCGISPAADPDDYVDGMDVSSAGVNRMGDAGDMPYGQFGDVGASNVTVVCIYAPQNSNADAGSATLVISYVVD